MGREALQRGPEESDREKARRKNVRSDIALILIVLGFSLFFIGFCAASAPIPTATVLWFTAFALIVGGGVLVAVNHFS